MLLFSGVIIMEKLSAIQGAISSMSCPCYAREYDSPAIIHSVNLKIVVGSPSCIAKRAGCDRITRCSSVETESFGTRRGANEKRAIAKREVALILALSGREGQEAGVDGVHAEVAHDSQCVAEEWDAVAGDLRPARLTVKTVACTFSFLSYFTAFRQKTTPLTFTTDSLAKSSDRRAGRRQ
jgi:hypothetical protein